jgi:hypothetical protein
MNRYYNININKLSHNLHVLASNLQSQPGGKLAEAAAKATASYPCSAIFKELRGWAWGCSVCASVNSRQMAFVALFRAAVSTPSRQKSRLPAHGAARHVCAREDESLLARNCLT